MGHMFIFLHSPASLPDDSDLLKITANTDEKISVKSDRIDAGIRSNPDEELNFEIGQSVIDVSYCKVHGRCL